MSRCAPTPGRRRSAGDQARFDVDRQGARDGLQMIACGSPTDRAGRPVIRARRHLTFRACGASSIQPCPGGGADPRDRTGQIGLSTSIAKGQDPSVSDDERLPGKGSPHVIANPTTAAGHRFLEGSSREPSIPRWRTCPERSSELPCSPCRRRWSSSWPPALPKVVESLGKKPSSRASSEAPFHWENGQMQKHLLLHIRRMCNPQRSRDSKCQDHPGPGIPYPKPRTKNAMKDATG